MLQISCVTATPVLSDRERFPNYFQFLPSMVDFAPAYIGIIKEFNWRHVVVLLQDENLYTLVIVIIIMTCNEKKDHSVKMVVWSITHRPTGFLQNDYTCASVHRVDCTIYTVHYSMHTYELYKKKELIVFFFLIAAGYVCRVVLCSCSLCSEAPF